MPKNNGNGHNFADAPASLTLKLSYRGYDDILFSLRDETGVALLNKLDKVLDHLEQMGAEPAKRGQQTGGGKVCKYHGPMKESTKAPGTWYCPAKMADGSYCKEKAS